MSAFVSYKGGIKVIAGFMPHHGCDYPLMEIHSIQSDNDGSRLDETLGRVSSQLDTHSEKVTEIKRQIQYLENSLISEGILGFTVESNDREVQISDYSSVADTSCGNRELVIQDVGGKVSELGNSDGFVVKSFRESDIRLDRSLVVSANDSIGGLESAGISANTNNNVVQSYRVLSLNDDKESKVKSRVLIIGAFLTSLIGTVSSRVITLTNSLLQQIFYSVVKRAVNVDCYNRSSFWKQGRGVTFLKGSVSKRKLSLANSDDFVGTFANRIITCISYGVDVFSARAFGRAFDFSRVGNMQYRNFEAGTSFVLNASRLFALMNYESGLVQLIERITDRVQSLEDTTSRVSNRVLQLAI